MAELIIGTSILGLYTAYNLFIKNKDWSKNNVGLEPDLYHDICRKLNREDTIFTKLVNTYFNQLIQTNGGSAVYSEVSFNQLTLLNNPIVSELKKKKEDGEVEISDTDSEDEKKDKIISKKTLTKLDTYILFYKTLNNKLIEEDIKIENLLVHNKKLQFSNKNASELYSIKSIGNKELKSLWRIFDESSDTTNFDMEGNLILANKIIINKQIKKSIFDETEDNIIIYDNIMCNEDESLYSIKIDKNLSLIIFKEDRTFDKKWIYSQMKKIEKKEMELTIPALDISSAIDLKKIKTLNTNFTEFNKKTKTGNIISTITVKLSGSDNEYKSKKKIDKVVLNKFKFCINHLGSKQIICVGLCNTEVKQIKKEK